MEFLADLLRFLKQRRKYYLIPVIMVILLIGAVLIFGSNSIAAPFIYSLF